MTNYNFDDIIEYFVDISDFIYVHKCESDININFQKYSPYAVLEMINKYHDPYIKYELEQEQITSTFYPLESEFFTTTNVKFKEIRVPYVKEKSIERVDSYLLEINCNKKHSKYINKIIKTSINRLSKYWNVQSIENKKDIGLRVWLDKKLRPQDICFKAIISNKSDIDLLIQKMDSKKETHNINLMYFGDK